MTLLQLCVARVGHNRGGLAAAAFAQHAIAMAETGKFPTAVEYADYWAISERTAWRHRARCERVAGDKWPELVAEAARYLEQRSERSPREAMRADVAAAW